MTHSYRVAVLLSGCGVYDGSEIHETVLTLLELNRHGAQAICAAPYVSQHHVIDHRSGAEQPEARNVLTESARIARGAIVPLSTLAIDDFDAIVIPGGFGVAKNFTTWAFDGPNGSIEPSVQSCIIACRAAGKPIVGLCMAGTTIARALQGTDVQPNSWHNVRTIALRHRSDQRWYYRYRRTPGRVYGASDLDRYNTPHHHGTMLHDGSFHLRRPYECCDGH